MTEKLERRKLVKRHNSYPLRHNHGCYLVYNLTKNTTISCKTVLS